MSSPPFTPIFKLTPGVQSYDWGKIGSTSLAAQFAEQCIEGFVTDEKKPYAELWMGTHPTLPSTQTHTSLPLSQILASSPSRYLSRSILQKYPNAEQGQLPFLFKVLSIGKALSIQAHPDKELAERLFRERPEVYKDPNHKPEMAIALTPFVGFCGFLPLPQLLLLLSTIPEMRGLIGEAALERLASTIHVGLPPREGEEGRFGELEGLARGAGAGVGTNKDQKDALKEVFEILMTAPENKIRSTLRALISRYNADSTPTSTSTTSAEHPLIPLVLQLNSQFPDDVGVLCSFILNVVELDVGKSVFLKADEPHAYISGDIIECMATSDNVVRAGLTPKLRDVPTLISMLTYTSAPADAQLLVTRMFGDGEKKKTSSEEKEEKDEKEKKEKKDEKEEEKERKNTSSPSSPSSRGSKTELFDPPIEEFSVLRTALKCTAGATGVATGGEKETHRPIKGPSIMIITEGSGKVYQLGGQGGAEGGAEEDDPDSAGSLDVRRGDVVFIAADIEVGFEAAVGGKEEDEFVFFRAFVEA